MSRRRKGRFFYLNPRTATYPMLLERYLELNERTAVVDDARLTPEWKAWFAKTHAKHLETN